MTRNVGTFLRFTNPGNIIPTEMVLASDYDALLLSRDSWKREAELNQADADASARYAARLAEVEHDLATLRLFVLTHDEGLLTEFDEFGLSNAVSASVASTNDKEIGT